MKTIAHEDLEGNLEDYCEKKEDTEGMIEVEPEHSEEAVQVIDLGG